MRLPPTKIKSAPDLLQASQVFTKSCSLLTLSGSINTANCFLPAAAFARMWFIRFLFKVVFAMGEVNPSTNKRFLNEYF